VYHKESGVYYPPSMKLWFHLAVVTCALTSIAGAQTTIFGSNIIVNPGAESGPGGDGTAQVANVPGWSRTGGCDVFGYATAANKIHGIAPNDIVPVGAGNNYFSGGIQPASCTFTQTIDLSAGAATIDAGTVTFAAAAYLGGFGADKDNATFTIAFQGASGNQLSTLTLGPVGPDDRADQDNGLYLRRQIGQIPAGTRSAALTLNMNWVDGFYNEAYADNLALTLNSPAKPQSLLGVNLIVNPGADASPGLTETSTNEVSTDLPGWVRSAFLAADSYQDIDGDLYQYTGGPPDAGINYFYGGIDVSDGSNQAGTAYQDIDVSSAASLIDAGNLAYTLSGWLGGLGGQDDNSVLTVQFQSWSGTVLGTATLGPVTDADRDDNSELLQKSTKGSVPSGTRVMHVLLTITRVDGLNNDGVADSLSLVLGSGASGGSTIPTIPCAGAGSGATSLNCAQGASFAYDVGQELEQITSMFNGTPGVAYTYSFAVTAGTLPPGLTLSPSGVLSGTLTAAGQFTFTITLTETIAQNGTIVSTQSYPFPFTFGVSGQTGPAVTIDPSGLSFNLTQSGAAVTQSVTIANHGTKALQFSATATTNSGGNWLTPAAATGSVASFASSAIAITADPSQLTPGTYSGAITISVAGGQTLEVSVLAVVTTDQPDIQLSQTGLRFQAVSGGTATSPQTIAVLNAGAGTLDFTATTSAISGGSWLSVSPSSGASSSSDLNAVTVTVNPAGLQAGDYYGKVQFSAAGAVNSPQIASVVLNVLPPDASPGAFVQPSGLIFVGSAGGMDPAAQTLSITNPSPNPLAYLVTSFTNGSSGSSWLAATPLSGSVSASEPASVSVQPNLQGLAPGVYTADLTFNIAPADAAALTPQTLHIAILLLVLPAGSSSSAKPAAQPRTTSNCLPTKLLPVFTLLGTGFTAAVAWPTALEVTVVDDCGNPLASGSVTATFSSGDPALALDSLHDGRWTATWNATHPAAGVTITAQAQEIEPVLSGSVAIGGALQPNTATPAVESGGVVSAANFVANQPLAPGAFAAIFGANLSSGLTASTKLPLSLQLGDTSAILAGKELPLLFTSGGQVNVVVPFDVPVNTTQQLVIQKGSAISIPQSVVIAEAQPAIFTQNGFGTGAVLINVYKPDGTALPNNSSVSAGDVIILYCSGLGAVNPLVAAGSPAPASPLSKTVNPVSVTIGKAQAQVLFAGLAPSFAQLYQVNVQIPTGLKSGSAVLTLAVGGQQSAPVSITVK
jgi:uncharacterized protein (TIGR03437 family)